MVFTRIEPTPEERAAPLPGDRLIPDPELVLDRAFELPADPTTVWPWLVQLGRRRAGWYLPRWVERAIPPRRRALGHVEPALQDLRVGDRIDDWGGSRAFFDVVELEAPRTLVLTQRRGRILISWTLALHPTRGGVTRIASRMRVRSGRSGRGRPLLRLAEPLDAALFLGLAAGLEERIAETARSEVGDQPRSSTVPAR